MSLVTKVKCIYLYDDRTVPSNKQWCNMHDDRTVPSNKQWCNMPVCMLVS